MKLAFIGDIHIDDKQPKFRSDDYCQTIAKKLNWALTWCRENNVDKVILLGDVFNKKEVGGRARNLTIQVFKKHISAPNAPEILCTIGNHDTGNDMINFKNTTLFTLSQVGFLTIKRNPAYDPESMVAFGHHTVKIDQEISENGLMHPEALIWALHAAVYYQPSQYGIDFNHIEINGPAKLLVCGHIHSAYQCRRSDGIELINPGPIARTAFTPGVRNQKIQMLVVEHDRKSIIKKDFIDIPYMDVNDVFHIEKIQMQKSIKKQVKSLIETTDDYDIDTFSVHNIIDLAKKQKLSADSIELITKYLVDAELATKN